MMMSVIIFIVSGSVQTAKSWVVAEVQLKLSYNSI